MNWGAFLNSFKPHNTSVPLSEKIRSGLIAAVAIVLLGLLLQLLLPQTYPVWMFASMGASAMLLFAAPHSPMSQPWNLVGGHLVAAITGLLCMHFIPEPLLAAGASVGAAIFLMHYLNCLHPPGAATALMIVLNSTQFQIMGWKWVLLVAAVNTLLSLLLALVINNLIPGRKYPMPQLPQTPAKPIPAISLEQRDLEWALEQMDAVIDVSEDDLAKIYALALANAQARYDSALNK